MNNKKIKRNKFNSRKIIFGIMLIIILALLLILVMGNKNTYSNTEIKYKKVFVSNGDTLWELASMELANNTYYENEDVRYIMQNIKDINKMQSSEIYVGQELTIPTF